MADGRRDGAGDPAREGPSSSATRCGGGPGAATRRLPGTTSAAREPAAATADTHGREPKNRFGESLFAVTVADGLRWARSQQAAEVVAVLPRYNPGWSWWLLRVPVLREMVTWNLVVVLRKR